MTTPEQCAPSQGGVPGWARGRYASLFGVLVWLPLLLVAPVVAAVERPSWGRWAAIAVVSAAFAGAVALSSRYPVTPARRRAAVGLFLVAAAACVGGMIAAPESLPLFVLLAIAAPVVFPRYGLVAAAAVTILAVNTVVLTAGNDLVVGALVATGLSGFGTWAVRRLFMLVDELARTREELARTAVSQERLRFSRDLHDLLGHTLSVIVVKAEAVRRLAPVDGAAAATHAADIETIGRQALEEVRQAVTGYRGAGLPGELERARLALDAAGVRASVIAPDDDLPGDVEALLGWVVREGVTNVVRHAGARRCTIELTRERDLARLTITDDGRAAAPADPARPGGLEGLRQRALELRGRLEAGPSPYGGWRLTAEVPCPPRTPTDPDPGPAARAVRA